MKKKLVFALIRIIGITSAAFAYEEGDCKPSTAFSGSRCCVYSVEDDPYVSTLIQKCCDHRIPINFGCDEVAFYP